MTDYSPCAKHGTHENRHCPDQPSEMLCEAKLKLSNQYTIALQAEIRRLRAAGELMYRAIWYTSGVDLNFAADEWRKAATEETP